MPKFFTDQPIGEQIILGGETAKHIVKSLRMKVGEEVVLCDGKGYDYACVIERIGAGEVHLKRCFQTKSESEADIRVELYQGLPKGDKLGDVVRRCTELGVFAFHPVLMRRSVVQPDEKSAQRKRERLQKIAAQAAEQSRRGIIPEVFAAETFEKALLKNDCQKTILFYENGGERLNTVLKSFADEGVKSVALIIGPEGGFEKSEVAFAKEQGAVVCTLGKRILRTETAPVVAAANVMYEMEKF